MATYKYEVIQADGTKRTGTIEAASQDVALADLKAGGNFVTSLTLGSALDKDFSIQIGAPVSTRELSVFCRQFQSLLTSGVTAVDAVDMLGQQSENKVFKAALEDIKDKIEQGETIAQAFSVYPKIFPDIMVQMIAAGEASGALETAFDRVGKQFETDARTAGAVKKALIYPIVLICVIIGVVIVMMVYIVPNFTSSFAEVGAELPGITKAVMAVSDFFVQKWYIMLGAIIALVVTIKAVGATDKGAVLFGRLALKAPLFGNLTIKTASARLCSNMSTLMASGITMVEAVGIVEKLMDNRVVKDTMKDAKKEVEIGVPLSVPLEQSGVFPPMVYQMIRIGEETGNMESMLDKISDYYDEEVQMATESLLAAMEPLIIIVMAGVVVPIILAILMPMFSMYSAVENA